MYLAEMTGKTGEAAGRPPKGLQVLPTLLPPPGRRSDPCAEDLTALTVEHGGKTKRNLGSKGAQSPGPKRVLIYCGTCCDSVGWLKKVGPLSSLSKTGLSCNHKTCESQLVCCCLRLLKGFSWKSSFERGSAPKRFCSCS